MPEQWNAIAVLSGGPERERCLAALGPIEDAELVRAVLAYTGHHDELRPSPGAIARLCAVIRALGALIDGVIEPAELRTGLIVHERATSRFARFGDARAALRTLAELVGDGAPSPPASVLIQLRRWLLDALEGWLVGDDPGELRTDHHDSAADSTRRWAASDPPARLLDLADEFTGTRSALTGARRDRQIALAARRDGWVAVPRGGERFADSARAVQRLLDATSSVDASELWAVSLTPVPAWRLAGGLLIESCPAERRCWKLPAAADTITAFDDDRTVLVMFTTPALDFTIVEAGDYHVVCGQAETLELLLGVTPAEAKSAFREWLERYHGGDDPPPQLTRVLAMYAHPRRVPPLD